MGNDDTSDPTQVTGSPAGLSGPRRGEVVAERYEIRERIRQDPFGYEYRAFDQETEASVLLRVIRAELLPTQVLRKNVVRRLQEAVGIGGKFLPGLIDADRDGAHVFTVEPMPAGATFRQVLDERAASRKRLTAEELLPVIARVDAAFRAVPPPFHHGDVRAERVWFDAEGFALLGPFLVPSLPPSSVTAALASDSRLGRVLAPETARGSAGDAADRYGAGVIALEALAGEIPGLGDPDIPTHLGEVGKALGDLLAADPARRAKSLDPLMEALARQSGLPVPDLEPGGFRRPRRLALPRPTSEQGLKAVRPTPSPEVKDGDKTDRFQAVTDGDLDTSRTDPAARLAVVRDTLEEPYEGPAATPVTLPDGEESIKTTEMSAEVVTSDEPAVVVRRREIEGASPEGTQEITFDQVIEEVGAEAEAPPAAEPAETTLPDPVPPAPVVTTLPQGVAAGPVEPAAAEPAPGKHRPIEALDPRLVRAALGVAKSDDAPAEPAATPKRKRPIRDTSLDLTPPVHEQEPRDTTLDVGGSAPSPRVLLASSRETHRGIGPVPHKSFRPSRDTELDGIPTPARATRPQREVRDTVQDITGHPAGDSDALDPRLVRAALGVTLDDTGKHAPIKKDPTLELGADDIEMVEAMAAQLPETPVVPTPVVAIAAPPRAAAVPGAPRGHSTSRPLPAPPGAAPPSAPPPSARPDDEREEAAVLFDDSRVSSRPPPPPEPPALDIAVFEEPPIIVRERARPTIHLSREALPPPRKSSSAKWILLFSLLFAIVIIAGSVLYANYQRDQRQREDERRLQERFQELQRESGQPANPAPGP